MLEPFRPTEPAMLGLTRAAALGVMVGTRGAMLRLGVRMMLCAWAAGAPRNPSSNPPRQTNGTAAISVGTAARPPALRLASRWLTMGPLAQPSTRDTCSGCDLLRSHGKADDLFILQFGDQACNVRR